MLLVHLPASSIYPLTEFFELFNFPAALELCSLATGGTQEIAEGLARRPEGESQIAESGLKAIDYTVNAIFENVVRIEVHKDSNLQI